MFAASSACQIWLPKKKGAKGRKDAPLNKNYSGARVMNIALDRLHEGCRTLRDKLVMKYHGVRSSRWLLQRSPARHLVTSGDSGGG